jgi:pyruvate/2-oxoglutarate dehydrogenase complex dihydrolipoamide acyltransferase (E2) component
MKVLTNPMHRAALSSLAAGLIACVSVATAHAEDKAAPTQTQAPAKAKPKKAQKAPPPTAAEPTPPPAAAAKVAPVAPAPKPEPPPLCTLGEAEQPRGGKLDVLGEHFGSAPVVRIAGKPARILLRKQDRISVQIPADSNGGPITLTDEKKNGDCGTLVIIGKDR